MVRRIWTAFFVLLLAVVFSTLTFSQEKQEMKKDDMKKESAVDMKKMDKDKSDNEMGPLKSISCNDACGFMVRSRSEKEVMSIMKSHAKKTHKMEMTEKQMKDMMKTEGDGDMKK